MRSATAWCWAVCKGSPAVAAADPGEASFEALGGRIHAGRNKLVMLHVSQHAAAACVKPPTPNHSVSAELLPIIVHTLLALRKYQPRLCCWAGARLN